MKAYKKELTMLGVLLALFVGTALANPNFLGADNLSNNVRHVALIRPG
jgi:ribose/xylose/arabinose/galactoside ABC-type transport system permease subunit